MLWTRACTHLSWILTISSSVLHKKNHKPGLWIRPRFKDVKTTICSESHLYNQHRLMLYSNPTFNLRLQWVHCDNAGVAPPWEVVVIEHIHDPVQLCLINMFEQPGAGQHWRRHKETCNQLEEGIWITRTQNCWHSFIITLLLILTGLTGTRQHIPAGYRQRSSPTGRQSRDHGSFIETLTIFKKTLIKLVLLVSQFKLQRQRYCNVSLLK